MGTLLITYMNTYGVQVVHNVFAFSLVRKSVGIIVSKTFYHNLQTIIYSTNNVTVNHNRFYIFCNVLGFNMHDWMFWSRRWGCMSIHLPMGKWSREPKILGPFVLHGSEWMPFYATRWNMSGHSRVIMLITFYCFYCWFSWYFPPCATKQTAVVSCIII